MAPIIRLIVGLGNPGSEYVKTRHNAGVWFVNEIARRHQVNLMPRSRFSGYLGRFVNAGEDILLLLPSTFMNLSGNAIKAVADFYRIKVQRILVAHDEMELPVGVVRLKLGGGHGGHNGLKNSISKLANERNFYRLRIGIGHPNDRSQIVPYVLGKTPENEKQQIDLAIHEAVLCLDILLKDGLINAQNRLHSFRIDY